ncbi:MAG: radical SAM protein, partial [Bacilli bacterium]|nr:radical SAM protein [Bacilli bacterium]
MKVFLALCYSCGVNSAQHEIEFGLNAMDNCEIVEKPEEADVIIFPGTCSCHEERILHVANYIASILDRKKKGAKTYLTGCMTRDFIDDEKLNYVKVWLENNIDEIVPSNRIIDLLNDLNDNNDDKDFEVEPGFSFYLDDEAYIYLSSGCTHKCSFCKTTFQNIPLVSMNLNFIKEYIDRIDEAGIETLSFRGMNICQLGLDTSGKYLLPDVIEYVEKKENIKNVVLLGFAYADAINNDFKYVLRKSRKVKYIIGSLESGENRLLSLMNKGYRIEDFLDFVWYINQEYEKLLDVNIIAGFPTEPLEDVRKTKRVFNELK